MSLGIAVVGVGNAGFEHLRPRATPRAHTCRPSSMSIVHEARRPATPLGLDCAVSSASTTRCVTPRRRRRRRVAERPPRGQSVAAARAGALLLEKPVALTPEALDRMLVAVQDAGVLCQVDMILRWQPDGRGDRRSTRSRRLGDLFCVEADFVFGELEGAEPDWARGPTQGGKRPPPRRLPPLRPLAWLMARRSSRSRPSRRGALPLGYDVTAITLVRFANGGVGRATTTLEAASPYRFGSALRDLRNRR